MTTIDPTKLSTYDQGLQLLLAMEARKIVFQVAGQFNNTVSSFRYLYTGDGWSITHHSNGQINVLEFVRNGKAIKQFSS